MEQLLENKQVIAAYYGLISKDAKHSWELNCADRGFHVCSYCGKKGFSPSLPDDQCKHTKPIAVSIYQAAFEMRDALDYVTWFSKLIEIASDCDTAEITAETLGDTPDNWIKAAVLCYEDTL